MPPSSSRAAAASRSRPSSSSCAATGASLDQPDRTVIISRERAYHGLAGYGTSIVGTEAFKVGVGPLAGGTARVAWDSAEALEATILELGAGARGGVLLRADHRRRRRPAPARRLPPGGARDLPRARGPVRRRRGDLRLRARRRLVRVQPRRARSRRGHVREGDHLRLRARSAASSSAARSRSRSGDAAPPGVWRHGYTYSGHASAAAAAHANLDIIEREGLVARGLELETEIPAALAPLLDHELVSEIRGGHRRRRRGPDRPGAARRRPGPDRPRHAEGPRPRRAHAHARRRRPADLAAARDHARRARRGRVRPAWRARRRRCCALGAGTASTGSRGRDPSGRSCGTPR